MSDRHLTNRSTLVLVIPLLILAILYQGLGYYFLLSGAEFNFGSKSVVGGSDLRQRWIETQYILRGHTKRSNNGQPVEISMQDRSDLAGRDGELRELDGSDGTVGTRVRSPSIGGYPPWAFLAGMVALYADWTTTRFVFAFLNLLATLVIVVWVWRVGRQYGRNAIPG